MGRSVNTLRSYTLGFEEGYSPPEKMLFWNLEQEGKWAHEQSLSYDDYGDWNTLFKPTRGEMDSEDEGKPDWPAQPYLCKEALSELAVLLQHVDELYHGALIITDDYYGDIIFKIMHCPELDGDEFEQKVVVVQVTSVGSESDEVDVAQYVMMCGKVCCCALNKDERSIWDEMPKRIKGVPKYVWETARIE